MPLLGEGTTVWRPVAAKWVRPDTFQVIGPMPDDEKWAFAPGSVVTVATQMFADGLSGLAAVTASN